MACSHLPDRSLLMPSTSPTRAVKQSSLAVAVRSSKSCQAIVRSSVTGPMISAFQLTNGWRLVDHAPSLRHHAANVAQCHYILLALIDITAQEQLPTSSVHFVNIFAHFSTQTCWCFSHLGQCLVNLLGSHRTHHTSAEYKSPRLTLILQRTWKFRLPRPVQVFVS